MREKSYASLVQAIQCGHKPYKEEWLVSDEDGFTIAHYYATHFKLPANFPYWDRKDNSGWSVAHAAAYNKNLPNDFSQWSIQDAKGDTVAHIAVRVRKYDPNKFSQKVFMTKNNEGVTVWDEVCLDAKHKVNQAFNVLNTPKSHPDRLI